MFGSNPAPAEKMELSENDKKSLKELAKLQEEYYKDLAEEMKDDCDTYKKGTECHDYAKTLMYNLNRTEEGLAQFEFNCNDYKIGNSCHDAAEAYLIGEIVERDAEKALKYYDMACKGDFPQSCIKIAKLYQYGKLGVEKDPVKAFEYLAKGCQKNSVECCAATGVAHLQGMGTEKSPEKALPILEDACMRANSQACHNLGAMYYHGEGVEKDKKKFGQFNIKSKILAGKMPAFDQQGRPMLPQEPLAPKQL